MKFSARMIAVLLAVVFAIPTYMNTVAYAAEPQMRGVWVSTVYSMDYPQKQTVNPQELMQYTDEIIDDCKNMGMNAIFLQVRPSSDALYKSEMFPWSKYLTGQQDLAPEDEFDPLQYWVEKAHENGIELHAWINPFRVAVSDSDFASLSENNPAVINDDWVVKHSNGQYYYNPGLKEVRDYVVDGVEEILSNYEVDGIHLDDYFYPGTDFDDAATYAKYGKKYSDIGDWRRNNINTLVKRIKEISQTYEAKFGISVAGIWANADKIEGGSDTNGNQSYFSSYADSREWVRQGWIDYICPQIYWRIGHSLADYQTLANWWAQVVSDTDVLLYIGMADYQAGNEDPDSAWYGISEIERQLELNRSIPQISGEVHFRYKFLAENKDLYKLYNSIYGGTAYKEEPEIVFYTHAPYMNGAGTKFKPDGKLTRAEAAIIFARLMTDKEGNLMFDENANYGCSFEDISKNAWYADAIGFMEEHSVLTGYSDGTYKPNNTITRAEFATLVARFEKSENDNNETGFSDVPEEHWAAGNIAAAVNKGYISGYGDGSFKPANQITRAESVKIINRMLGRTPDKAAILKYPGVDAFSDLSQKHWAYYEIIEATYEHRYEITQQGEAWKIDIAPEIPYISDTFNFVFPQLITTDPLEPLDLSKIEGIALHHMAHPTADFKTVEGWHLDQGWRAFGYNFWIDFNGNVYVGRGWNKGAGVANKNSKLLSIGFQGDYEKANKNMPYAQYKAGVELIKWISQRVPSITQVGGHGDFGATLCPGKYFPLAKMRKEAGF